MKNLGQALKEAREKKKLTREDIYKHIHIHPRVTEAIEEGRVHKEYSAIYVKSFLKKYAEFVGLNPEDIVRQYEAFISPPPETPRPPERRLPEHHLPGPPEEKPLSIDTAELLKYFRPGLVLVLAVVGALLIGRFIKRTVSSGAPSAVKPAAAIRRHTAARGVFTLKVVALDNTWIKAEADGKKVIFRNILSKGLQRTWEAQKQIKMIIGKPEVLKLYLNGKDLGKITKTRIVVTPQGIQ
jgi:transcriptional regulator with XRE-family HTH domain